MDKHRAIQRSLNMISIAAVLLLFIMGGFYFFQWLYAPANVVAFNYENDSPISGEKISNNLYINVINSVIPTAGMLYEQSYGYNIPGVASAAFSYSTEGLSIDLRNPLTYINMALPIFGQYNNGIVAASVVNGALPDIKNFNEVPEGTIYFTEEDEFTGDELNGIPSPENIEQTNEEDIEDPELVELSSKDPQILIYHTHASESYMPNTESNYRTTNEKLNVVGVGTNLTTLLQKNYKLRVIHDKTYHDRPSYSYSYINSLKTIKKQMELHKSLKVLIDVHRDAFTPTSNDQKSSMKAAYTAIINGKSAARVMLIVGTKNQNYKELEKFAVYIKKKMDKLYPGLCVGIKMADKKYNLYNSNYAALLEVGCMVNTSEEAKYSSELMAEVLGQVIGELKQ